MDAAHTCSALHHCSLASWSGVGACPNMKSVTRVRDNGFDSHTESLPEFAEQCSANHVVQAAEGQLELPEGSTCCKKFIETEDCNCVKNQAQCSQGLMGSVDARIETLKLGFEKTTEKSELDLKCHPALPHDWEQFLNLKTGEVYYMDWSTCKKARYDPRELYRLAGERINSCFKELFSTIAVMEKTLCSHLQVIHSSSSSSESGEDCYTLEDGFSDWDTENVSESSMDATCEAHKVDTVLDLMGCRRCLIYILCPKGTPECSTCGSALVHINAPAN